MPLRFLCTNCNYLIITSKEEFHETVTCPNCKTEPYIPSTAFSTNEEPNDNKEVNQEHFLPQAKHLAKFKELHQQPNEVITSFAAGYIGNMMGKGAETQHNGMLIVSNERIVFYKKGFITDIFEYIPLKKISSVERKSTLTHKTLRIHTSNDELEFKFFDSEGLEEKHLVEAIEIGRDKVSTQLVQKEQTSNPLDDLKKLAELRDLGVITSEEFEEKKKILLSKL